MRVAPENDVATLLARAQYTWANGVVVTTDADVVVVPPRTRAFRACMDADSVRSQHQPTEDVGAPSFRPESTPDMERIDALLGCLRRAVRVLASDNAHLRQALRDEHDARVHDPRPLRASAVVVGADAVGRCGDG